MRPVRPKTPSTSTKKQGPPTKPKPNVGNGNGNGNGNQWNKDNKDSKDKEPVEVFCRLRPMKDLTDLVAIRRYSDTLVQLTSPNGNKNSNVFYNFKYVFDESTTQKMLFDHVAFPLVEDLLKGKSGLLFTYGITSSGKTHTLTGDADNSGILPRSLDVIFNSIGEYQSRKYVFKPDGFNYFEIQSSPDALLDWQRARSASTPSTPGYGRTPKKRRDANVEENWESRVRDNGKIEDVNTHCAFGVFISYVEIYNNYIYDLLDDSMFDPIRMFQPQSKILREDSRKRVFVQNGTEVEVKNAEEAIQLFLKGIRKRRIAHTNLNTESSRSHSVFTIRLVQAPIDNGGEVLLDTRFATVSQLSLVDLAGSERTIRTKNTGERLKESGRINNSLMSLRSCIEILRENQRSGSNKMVPYRDNKLTHLFKSYFEGEGKIRMIICANPSAEDYDETLHVMKFAECAQEVLVTRGMDAPVFQFNYNTIPKHAESHPRVDFASLGVFGPPLPKSLLHDPEDDKLFPEWLECLEMRKRNKQVKLGQLQEHQLDFRRRLSEMEQENMVLKQQNIILQMDLGAREHQMKSYQSKCTEAERQRENQLKRVFDLERKVKALEQENQEKDRYLNQEEIEKGNLKSKFRERLDSERERLRRMFDRVLAEKEAELEREQCVSKEKMHLVREILNADNTNWDFLKENRDNYYPTPSAPLSTMPSSNLPASQASTQTPKASCSEHKRKSDYDLANYLSPAFRTPQSNAGQTEGTTVGANSGPPVVNPRHRRSLSAGTERWIDHRPPGTISLGTVMQPKIKNKKSVTNLKVTDVQNASKYALTHHEADNNGDVETFVYKGEVIPSTSGGAQVIFNDVETLKQASPQSGRKRAVSETRLLSPSRLMQHQILTEADVHIPSNNNSKRHRV